MLAAVVANFPKDVNARVSLATRYIELKDTTRALETLQPMSDSFGSAHYSAACSGLPNAAAIQHSGRIFTKSER